MPAREPALSHCACDLIHSPESMDVELCDKLVSFVFLPFSLYGFLALLMPKVKIHQYFPPSLVTERWSSVLMSVASRVLMGSPAQGKQNPG